MSEPSDKAAASPATQERGHPHPAPAPGPPSEPGTDPGRPGLRLSRRGWTLVLSGVLVVVFALVGAFVQVPYVALGPGPTYDVLGTVDGAEVVTVEGDQTFPTDGQLRMTTVSLNDHVTLFGALGMWVSGRFAVAPREDYFQPGETDEEVRRENARQFEDSQSTAEVAALRSLDYPVYIVVDQVVPDSPAQSVLEPGDRLRAIDGTRIASRQDVVDSLAGTKPGQQVDVTFERGQARHTESITLGNHPDGQPQGFIGIQPAEDADAPYDIDIALEEVGGPSAGLIFALTIVDRLTEESLTGGQNIAGTGVINDLGEVGPIGGISFKLVAAREAGATAFLVPARNCAEAAADAPDGLRLIKVQNLDGAISSLERLREGGPVPSC